MTRSRRPGFAGPTATHLAGPTATHLAGPPATHLAGPPATRALRAVLAALGAGLLALAALPATAVPAAVPAAAPTSAPSARTGARCTTAGATSANGLVCTRRAGRLVWARPAATTTVAGAAAAAGIDGAWKALPASVVGYRVKEILNGQKTEGVGRTSAVTGTLTIAGTAVTATDLTVDMKTLTSDSGRRDGVFHREIMETATFPTARLVLKAPIQLGTVPADRVQVTSKATVSLTLKSTTRDVPVDLVARRNGATIEVNGAIRIVFAEWGIPNPSRPPFVETEQEGLLEFLVVFGR
jgi:hypothetical protein